MTGEDTEYEYYDEEDEDYQEGFMQENLEGN